MTPCVITWNPDPVAWHVLGFSLRWYSLCWAAALLLGAYNMARLYRRQNIPEEVFSPLFTYCFVGVLVGARLGHCLFYEPSYYLHHIVEMLLPIRQYADGWKMVGYEGLASHGGVIGLLVAIWLYARRMGMHYLRVLDNMGIIAPLSAAFIRLGNLMNSEIVGVPTQMPWGFVFAANGEDFARHPAQLYEALFYIMVFVIGLMLYRRPSFSRKVGTGFFFGFCVLSIFSFRFLVEFIKADQVAREAGMLINIGQWLSIPLVVVGAYCMAGGKWCMKFAERPGDAVCRRPSSPKKRS